MKLFNRLVGATAAAGMLALTAQAAAAQEVQPYQQVISANPFGLLIEFFNGEYERVVGESSTAGVGGSVYNRDGFSYRNGDVFFRFYPTGQPLDGWSFGGKIGLTSVPDETFTDFDGGTYTEEGGTFFGLGFDVNRSWLLGKNNNFYVGAGFGLKRLYGVPDDSDMIEYIPTFRIVNVGFAF